MAAFLVSFIAFGRESYVLFFLFNSLGWGLLLYAVLKSIEKVD